MASRNDLASGASLVVDPRRAGWRLDLALVEELDGWSRSRVQRLVRDGGVTIDGEVVTKPGRILEEGQRVALARTEISAARTQREEAPRIAVLFADEHLVVVDKPPGVVVHPQEGRAGRLGGTVCEQVAERYGPLPQVQGENRPGVVHRLDRDTSGVMVLGRTLAALEHLKRQFAERTVQKTYLAIAQGDPRFDSDWIETPIGRSKRHPDRMSVMEPDEEGGREARTYYEVRERFGAFVHLACVPKTGRTHQIRVHLASIGHPVLFDVVYRTRGAVRDPYPRGAPRMTHQALHAWRLGIKHPASGEPVRWEAPVPEDFRRVLEYLQSRG